jgi:MFS family permease
MAPAVGGVIGGWSASWIVARLGSGPALAMTVLVSAAGTIVIGFLSSWVLVGLVMIATMLVAVVWNVITVSFRQSVIPDHLLGRVNSVYRFFGWGAIPVGALIGGLLVAALDGPLSREWALRLPWIITGLAHLPLLVVVLRRLTTADLDATRRAAAEDQTTDENVRAVDPAPR